MQLAAKAPRAVVCLVVRIRRRQLAHRQLAHRQLAMSQLADGQLQLAQCQPVLPWGLAAAAAATTAAALTDETDQGSAGQ